jgi:hypothetical protein
MERKLTSDDGYLSAPGSIADLLRDLSAQSKRPHQDPARRASRPRPPVQQTSRLAPKSLFLSELELSGRVSLAARRAGCTPSDVAAWRAEDPMFARDYVLAIAGHLRSLNRMIEEVAATHPSEHVRDQARRLLQSKSSYRAPDGRLDATAWRDALAEFGRAVRMELAQWEPALPWLDSGRRTQNVAHSSQA